MELCLHSGVAMKLALVTILGAAALVAQDGEDQSTDLNVNWRYAVESVSFADQRHYRLSSSVLEEMRRLVGSRVNDEAVKRLAARLRSELRAHDVTFRLARGGNPESVKVLFTVDKGGSNFDFSIPKFAYNSRQGWTGIGEGTATVGAYAFTFGALTDGDTLAERFSGVKTKYERLALGTDRIHLGFEFDAYHEQYNQATLDALENNPSSSLGAGAYRSRLNFEPSATFVLAKPLTLTVGLSFEQLQPQLSAARSVSATAVINTLRYHQRWQLSDATKQDLDAGYSLRAATRLLGTDLAYTRHAVNVRYGLQHARQLVEVALVAGRLYWASPLVFGLVVVHNQQP